jgi:DNA-binding transcriptional MerR regulator
MGEVTKPSTWNHSFGFYEKEFDILQPKKNARGNRKFTKEDIKKLKKQSFTLLRS